MDSGLSKEPRVRWGQDSHVKGSFEGESDQFRTSGGRYAQSDSAGDSTGSVRMPTGVVDGVHIGAPPGEYD